MRSGAESGPNFVLDWREPDDSQRHWSAGIGSLLVHAAVIAFVIALGNLAGPPPKQGTEVIPDFTKATHLYLPADLTQKAPNKGKVAKEVNVEDLKPRPPSQQRLPPAPAIRAFRPPLPQPPGPLAQPGPPNISPPPKLDTPLTAQNTPPVLPALSGTPKAPPPPQIEPVEKPKLTFETPGQAGPSETKGRAKLAPPKTDVQSVVREMAQGGGGQRSIVVGDQDQPPDLPASQ